MPKETTTQFKQLVQHPIEEKQLPIVECVQAGQLHTYFKLHTT